MCRGLDIWVSKVMESNLFEIKFAYHIGKVLGYEVRSKQVPHLIHADVIKVLFAVFLLEQFTEGFLLFLLRKEKLLDHRQERQRDRKSTRLNSSHL